jgi:hypothetical protein
VGLGVGVCGGFGRLSPISHFPQVLDPTFQVRMGL